MRLCAVSGYDKLPITLICYFDNHTEPEKDTGYHCLHPRSCKIKPLDLLQEFYEYLLTLAWFEKFGNKASFCFSFQVSALVKSA